jgi:phosphoribosyl-ATP pyrophosphohydrolase
MKFDITLLDFEKMNGLIPTIVKDERGNVLMLAYSSKESLARALEMRKGVYFSRSRNRLWIKGESSGNTQELIEIKTDCDKDSLLFIVKQKGNACHLNRYSCFEEEKKFDFQAFYDKIKSRINSNDENSYTRKLVADPELLKRKLIEESAEVITAKNKKELLWECADLLYFLFVIMAKEEVSINDVEKENLRREEETFLNNKNLNKSSREETKE